MDFELTPEFTEFIKSHKNDDPIKLRLRYRGSEPWIENAITHIQCIQKAGKKFIITSSGKEFRPEILLSPLSIEQSTSADIALFHRSLIEPGSKVLDMTMGLGTDTMAIATADNTIVTSCELSPLLAAAGRYNFAGYNNVNIIEGDSVEFLKSHNGSFDIIFIDPARRGETGQRVYNLHDCTPDLIDILPLLFEKSRLIIAKLSPMLDISQTLRDLPHTKRLYAVDNGSECKELLAVIEHDFNEEPDIIIKNGDNEFQFKQSQEQNSNVVMASPAIGMYLLEPSPAVMKAAPFKLMASRFNIAKLAHNTHLYLSSDVVGSFPGHQLRITDIVEFTSKEIKRFSTRYPEANITTRNFPLTVDQLYKKLKIKQSSPIRVFAVTGQNGKKMLIIAEPIINHKP